MRSDHFTPITSSALAVLSLLEEIRLEIQGFCGSPSPTCFGQSAFPALTWWKLADESFATSWLFGLQCLRNQSVY